MSGNRKAAKARKNLCHTPFVATKPVISYPKPSVCFA